MQAARAVWRKRQVWLQAPLEQISRIVFIDETGIDQNGPPERALSQRPAHKCDDARRAVERRGAWLLFLPPYSPDFNPIELAFSKFKAHMERLKPRTVDDLW